MTYEEAIRILDPESENTVEILSYDGFLGIEAEVKAFEDACRLACEAMEKQQAMTWRVVGCNEDGYLYNLPEDGQEILVSYQTYVAADIFVNDGEDGCYLESGEYIEVGMVWMPMPEPYEEERKQND